MADEAVHKHPSTFPYNQLTTIAFVLIFLSPIFLLLVSVVRHRDQFFYNPGAVLFVLLPIAVILPLTLWSFLRDPAVRIRRQKMELLSVQYPELSHRISRLDAFAKLPNPPVLLRIPDKVPAVFAFGTWRHQHLAIADGAIELWSDSDALRAVILHDLGHIANGDTWKASLALYFVQWTLIYNLQQLAMSMPPAILADATRAFGGLLGSLFFPLTLIAINLLLYVTVRFLFRIRELSADSFAAERLQGVGPLAAAFIAVGQRQWRANQPLAFLTEGLGNSLTKWLGFHPTISHRLKALQFPAALAKETSSIVLAIGLAMGLIVTSAGTRDTLDILITASLLTGPFVLIILLHQFPSLSSLQVLELLLNNALTFTAGAAIAMCVTVVFPSTYVQGLRDSSFYFRTAADMRYMLAYLLDVLVLLVIVMPLLLVMLTLFAWIVAEALAEVARALAAIVSRSHAVGPRPRWMTAWLMQLPGHILAATLLLLWLEGKASLPSTLVALVMVGCGLWGLLVLLVSLLWDFFSVVRAGRLAA